MTLKGTNAADLKIQVSLVTPFAQIDGILECAATNWTKIVLSTKIFPQMQRLTDYHGVCKDWRLKLHNLQSFLGLVGKDMDDIWLRFRKTEARIQIELRYHLAEGVNH